MASFTVRRIKGDSQAINMREEISVKKEFHVPPLTATMKDSKKKRKDTTKEKKKSRNGINHFRNSEKLQTEQWTNEEMSDAQRKAQAKAKERKSSKSKNPKSVSEGIPTEEDKSELTNVEQDSLRWEGALEDPTAEAQRLEVYRANRRKRYMASRQAFLQNIQTGLNLDSNTSKLNTRNKPGVLI
ncbi:protein LIAT1 isoform X1 [Puntigrus tetrazona]|uniref:protein LIAT1 isoform X1 n=1 Tax=Puntigrus tetrazona TaxID=1606681 RepID=UPI001C8A1A49|nr:protein LIAT1 isoform X1 [Puntigrus tetrazona]